MVVTMARYIARKQVKDHLRASGARIWDIEAADLNRAANALLECRREELIVEAKIMLAK
jgi:hypothetical protein